MVIALGIQRGSWLRLADSEGSPGKMTLTSALRGGYGLCIQGRVGSPLQEGSRERHQVGRCKAC